MRGVLILAAALLIGSPAAAETVEDLKAQLEAQKRINELQKQRIDSLEAQLTGRAVGKAPVTTTGPKHAADDPEGDRSLERALVRQGTAVLPKGTIEITPSFFWGHAGRDALSSAGDTYGAGLNALIGLPDGWMVGASVPFLHRRVDGLGKNTGVGDVSVSLFKSLLTQDGNLPSLVGSIRYSAPTGEDPADDLVSLGSGFHHITGRLSAVKTIDPIAFFGYVSYTHYIGEVIANIDADRSDAVGFGLGANLLVTPEITVSAGISFAFEDEIRINGLKIDGSKTTVGLADVSVGILLTRNVFLTVSAGFGVTDDSPDVTLGISLPVRF